MLAIKLLAEELGGLYVTPSNFEALFISMDTNRFSNSSRGIICQLSYYRVPPS